MSETLIKVEGLYKKFTRSLKRSMYYGTIDSLRTMVGMSYDEFNLRKSEFWALQNINLELKKGETLGIIGLNGSGKTTLLRLLSGVFPLDAGRIEINGRIGSLIAVGVGFHPHMSGRENIYLNGTILGMEKEEIKKKFDEIVDFAEIHESLDAPVATYSSGMKVRLGFSIAIHCEPETMLIDEVLSVGDIGFKNKSLRKLSEYRNKANGTIFISHDIEQVRVLCDRIIILDKGRVIYSGNTHEGIAEYEDLVRSVQQQNNRILFRDKIITGYFSNNVIELISLKLNNSSNNEIDIIKNNDSLNIVCEFKLFIPIEGLFFYMDIIKQDGSVKCISVVSNDENKLKLKELQPGIYKLLIDIKEHHLVPSTYELRISFRNDLTFETYFRPYVAIFPFIVQKGTEKLDRGIVNVQEKWSLTRL